MLILCWVVDWPQSLRRSLISCCLCVVRYKTHVQRGGEDVASGSGGSSNSEQFVDDGLIAQVICHLLSNKRVRSGFACGASLLPVVDSCDLLLRLISVRSLAQDVVVCTGDVPLAIARARGSTVVLQRCISK